MTNGFLISVPHEGLHGAISILEQRPELPTNVRNVGSQRHNAARCLLHLYHAMCTGATAGGPLASLPCSTGKECKRSEIASTIAPWKEVWGCQNTADYPMVLTALVLICRSRSQVPAPVLWP